MLAKTKTTLPQNLPGTVAEVARQYGDSIVLTADERLQETGVVDALKTTFSDVFVWDHTKGEESIAKAEAAKVGIVFADYAIADCGFAVLLSSKERARSVSLPENNIIVIRRSTILPRVAQLAEILHQRAQARERSVLHQHHRVARPPRPTSELIKVVGARSGDRQLHRGGRLIELVFTGQPHAGSVSSVSVHHVCYKPCALTIFLFDVVFKNEND